MKINQIIVETTTSGAVATVAQPLGGVQKRSGNKKAGSMFKGKTTNKPFYEAEINEEDIILVPGQSTKRKTGFVPHGQSRVDHEVEMAKSDLLQLLKNTETVLMCVKDRTEDEGLEGWVQEKIIKASDYMNTLAEYLEGKRVQEMTGGVIAGGGVGEGAKVDRMVKHITKSEKKLGHSKKEAENIAWATANKRGYLDNKNKKK